MQRSAGYDGNPYELLEIGASSGNNGEHPWTYNEDDAIDYVVGRQYFFTEEVEEEFEDIFGEKTYGPSLNEVTDYYETELSPESISKIMPGDILYYYTEFPKNYHVGIVAKVEYTNFYSRSEVSLEDIKIIEATWNSDPVIGNVTNSRSLYYFDGAENDWRIGRLK